MARRPFPAIRPLTWYSLVAGRDLNRTLGCEDSMPFCLSLSGDACCVGETRRQELAGSVQRRGRFLEDRVIGLEDVGHPG